MSEPERTPLETEIYAEWEAGRFEQAAHQIIEGYGPQILGFIMNLTRDEVATDEAFSLFCEDMWKGLAAFQWKSSLRTWLYTLARHATYRWQKAPARRRERNLGLSQAPGLVHAVEKVRTQTRPHLQTEIKDRFFKLREALSVDERTLLVLRVDRQLPWSEIAAIMADEGADAQVLKKEAARQRKRFQLLKGKLRELAVKEGLLDSA